MEKVSKLIFDAKIARALCKKGYHIIDIKPMRGEPNKTVFVFENTDEFQVAFSEILNEIKSQNSSEEVESLTYED